MVLDILPGSLYLICFAYWALSTPEGVTFPNWMTYSKHSVTAALAIILTHSPVCDQVTLLTSLGLKGEKQIHTTSMAGLKPQGDLRPSKSMTSDLQVQNIEEVWEEPETRLSEPEHNFTLRNDPVCS